MLLVKKYIKPVLITLILVILFFATRLYNIGSLPLFTDEAIYVRWAQIAEQDANWRFISLTDGKQPSFIWATIVAMKFINDPLLAARLVSVFSGFLGMIGIFFLAREIFKNRRVGFFAAGLYLIYPFALVYDRMALYDSLVATFFIWSSYFTVLLIRLRRLDVALILGMVIGGGVLTKTSNFFSIYLLPISAVLFNLGTKNKIREFLKWIGLALISVFIAYAIYSILRLSPYFNIIGDKNNTFVYSFSEWINHPFTFFLGNLNGLKDWLISYATIPTLLLVIAAFFVDGKKFLLEKLLLLAWFVLPFVALAMFGKVLYPRFILFMTMPLLVLAAYSLNFGFEKIKNNLLKIALFAGVIFLMLRADYYILMDFARADIATPDLDQFINSWPAGGGYQELVELLEEEANSQEIFVYTEGTFGSLPTNTVEIYLDKNENIGKQGVWPVPNDMPREILDKASEVKVFFVFNQSQNPPPNWEENLRFITRYQKGVGDYYMSVYEVIPES